MHLHHPQHPQTSQKPKQSKSTYPQTKYSQSPTSTYHHKTHQPTPNPKTTPSQTSSPNSVITGDFNAHSNQWHFSITDHRGDHIASIIKSSSHSILNRNSHTRIPPNQNQQPTSPDIPTISSNILNKTQR